VAVLGLEFSDLEVGLEQLRLQRLYLAHVLYHLGGKVGLALLLQQLIYYLLLVLDLASGHLQLLLAFFQSLLTHVQ
jgi:hypothetical protein